MNRSVDQWKSIIAERGINSDLAPFVTGDLAHYRSGSRWEDEDEASLTALFCAIVEITNENDN
jgi:hypothetical protein